MAGIELYSAKQTFADLAKYEKYRQIDFSSASLPASTKEPAFSINVSFADMP
jgi:hypothetical protein